MDLNHTIRMLREEVAKIDAAIANLEILDREIVSLEPGNPTRAGLPTGKRRGRKSMGPEERAEVSARMKRYWAKRRRASK